MAKNKIKTHSGAKKRFKKLKSGKFKANHAYKRHILTKKTAKNKRQMRNDMYIKDCDLSHVKPLLPY